MRRSPVELADAALTVANEAAQIVLGGYRTHPPAELKGRADLVTAYDLASERWLRKRLAELTPEWGLVGEEEGGESPRGPTWYLDPLDGTTNFVHGHGYWAVSVGAIDHGIPIAGAVVAPVLQLSWKGCQAGGAYRNGEPCRVSDTRQIGDALVATGFPRQNLTREPDNNFASFIRVKQTVCAVRRCGSAALDLCLVADGTYDAYWERALAPWDIVGGLAIAVAAGATVTSLDGSLPELERGNILTSNGHLHQEMLKLVMGEARTC